MLNPETHPLPEIQADFVARAVLQVRQFDPTRDRDQSNLRVESFKQTLSQLNINSFETLRNIVGKDLYDNRFESWLVSLALQGNGLDPWVTDPTEILFRKTVCTYLAFHPEKLNQLHNRWRQSSDSSGIISPPYFHRSSSLDDQVEQYLIHGNSVDVYSKPNRYPNTFSALCQIVPEGGSVIELGAAAGHNLVALADFAKRRIGIDRLSLEEVYAHPMMKYRNQCVLDPSVEMMVGNMFDEQLVRSLVADSPKPVTLLVLNAVFPHFKSDYVRTLIGSVIHSGANYMAIGGGVPELDQVNPLNINRWSGHRQARIFDIREPLVKQIAHVRED